MHPAQIVGGQPRLANRAPHLAAQWCLLGATLLWSVAGCSQTYYAAMETLGVPKREMLAKRVKNTQIEQEKAKETFESALEHFRSVVTGDAGELERKYRDLKSQLARCESRAETVSERVTDVESVAEALFREWERELDEYKTDSLRQKSEAKLRDTRSRYDQLIGAMRRAEEKTEPVLAAFREQVLYLKHNLNAAAIASLQGEVITIERDVASLVEEMERAIAEADAFVAELD